MFYPTVALHITCLFLLLASPTSKHVLVCTPAYTRVHTHTYSAVLLEVSQSCPWSLGVFIIIPFVWNDFLSDVPEADTLTPFMALRHMFFPSVRPSLTTLGSRSPPSLPSPLGVPVPVALPYLSLLFFISLFFLCCTYYLSTYNYLLALSSLSQLEYAFYEAGSLFSDVEQRHIYQEIKKADIE